MLKALVPIAFVSILAATSVSAMPAPSTLPQLETAMAAETVQVQYRERGDRRDDHYVPGRRYNKAPGHYHRYAKRPQDWRRRSCILVGPVWFCP